MAAGLAVHQRAVTLRGGVAGVVGLEAEIEQRDGGDGVLAVAAVDPVNGRMPFFLTI